MFLSLYALYVLMKYETYKAYKDHFNNILYDQLCFTTDTMYDIAIIRNVTVHKNRVNSYIFSIYQEKFASEPTYDISDNTEHVVMSMNDVQKKTSLFGVRKFCKFAIQFRKFELLKFPAYSHHSCFFPIHMSLPSF